MRLFALAVTLTAVAAAANAAGQAPAARELFSAVADAQQGTAPIPRAKSGAARPASAAEQGGTLTIYVYPPSKPIDWSTPKKAMLPFLLVSALDHLPIIRKADFVSDFGEKGYISWRYKSGMGHTIAHLACTLPGGAPYESWSSFSGQGLPEVDLELLLKREIGLGMLFYDYVDGYIISGQENPTHLAHYASLNGAAPRYWQQKIGSKACADARDMVEFFKSFHFQEGAALAQLQARPPEKTLYFSSNMDPYKSYVDRNSGGNGKVGGGCAPYGLALLKIAGKYDWSLDDMFLLHIDISERLIGGIPDENGKLRRIPPLSLFGELGDSWTHPGYKNRHFKNYDPALIWKFIGEARTCLAGGNCAPKVREWLDKNRGRVSAGPAQEIRDTQTGGRASTALSAKLYGIVLE
ncbi:MAG: hypothetical protein PHP45_09710 [Elusimicrobiales bacterium]|nr:hypothetical protein [Elusimicrobiales bacterium]